MKLAKKLLRSSKQMIKHFVDQVEIQRTVDVEKREYLHVNVKASALAYLITDKKKLKK